MRCPLCQKELPSNAIACDSCGTSLDNDPTRRIESAKPPSGRSLSLNSIDDARFVPGTILDGRYRIVGLLGKGGMGEVYRADDLKLGQPVALKFLPDRFLSDGAALARFHREVRVARQVSHRNVCRVYDIGELDGHHFLSMEYIKGEELSSLLRRIGRLPGDKALQIARQLCAGLAAAHESGVMHRDLKPSNVMIDGDGNARILDFGLAGLAEEFRDDEISAGTPAYMAPEQLDGKAVTMRSDIYSLGLVLYELFTGKRAFDAATLGELMKLRRSDTTPATPTSIVKDLDPVVERVIDRCIQKDPLRRPSRALEVAAALPGGDPIAAALAAGETPSPEMIAAAPREGGLRPAVALTLLGGFLVTLTLVCVLSKKTTLPARVPLEKSSEVLKERAREITQRLGYNKPPVDTARGFITDQNYFQYVSQNDSSPSKWDKLASGEPPAIVFWYRQSPQYLVPFNGIEVTLEDPAQRLAGMVSVRLDTLGRLREFIAVPTQVNEPQSIPAASPSSVPDWSNLFREAGFDIYLFKPSSPQKLPDTYADARAAWDGAYPLQPKIPIHVEAASYQGRPVSFVIIHPWNNPQSQVSQSSTGDKILIAILIAAFLLALFGSALLAIRNLKLGRGDRKGALRLALSFLIFWMINWAFSAHHLPSFAEFYSFAEGVQRSLFFAFFFWLLYIALEPLFRRRWPYRIIAWNRFLAGGVRDPLVGREVLIGAFCGIATVLIYFLRTVARPALGDLPRQPLTEPGTVLLGLENFVPALTMQVVASLQNALIFVFLLLLLAIVLRKNRVAEIAAFLLAFFTLALLTGAGDLFDWVFALIWASLFVGTLFRFGLLAVISSLFFFQSNVFFPVTSNLSAWYATGFVLDLIVMLAIASYAFYISLAGQPLFSGKLLAED